MWTGLLKDEIKWDGTLYADKFIGDGSLITGIVTGVSSVFARTGAVVAAEGDYTVAQLDATALTAGSVLFSNGTDITQDNANFFWDDTNNRLGIGITAPQANLDIKSSGLSNEVQRWTASDGSVLASLYETNAGNSFFYLMNAAGTTTNFLASDGSNSYLNGGNVGIGTTGPTSKLHVAGSSPTLTIGMTNNAVGMTGDLDFRDDTNSHVNARIRQTAGPTFGNEGSLAFWTSAAGNPATAKMTIDINGKVGIGTASPTTLFHLSGGAATISNTTAPATPTGAGAFFVSGGAFFFIGSSGTVTNLAAA